MPTAGFACVWYYRAELTRGTRDFLLKGLDPAAGRPAAVDPPGAHRDPGLEPVNSRGVWVMHFAPHWQLGFAFLLGVGSVLVGLVLMAISIPIFRPYFSGQTLNRDTPVYLTEGEPPRPDTPLADSAANPARPPEGARD